MTKHHELQKIIEEGFATKQHSKLLMQAVAETLRLMDEGALRIASPHEDTWVIHQWLKQAILLSFGLFANKRIEDVPLSYDKVALKFAGWDEARFDNAKIRAVPHSVVRHSAYIGKNVILMPSFVNVGAYVDDGTMVDSWATIGSCAQIGKNCHISGGVGIGGVLEPLQASPVIIEDGCFIGARSEIAEGMHIGKGAVISMGVFLGASTKIIDRDTGEIFYGSVPPHAVVVPGSLPNKDKDKPSLAVAVIVKYADEKTRAKTSLNDLLREA